MSGSRMVRGASPVVAAAMAVAVSGGPTAAELPAEVRAFTEENLAACREVGGTPRLSGLELPGVGTTTDGRPLYLTEVDLNGDGRPDYVTDLVGLECENAWSYFCGSAGCPVTVWIAGTDGHTVAWGGHAQGWELRGTDVVLFLHGQMCNPPRVGADGCEMALSFDGTGGSVADPAPAPAAAPGASQPPRARPAAASAAPVVPTAPPPPAPTLPALMDEPAAGWSFDQTADGAGWFAGIADADSGARLDWLCAKGRQSYLAVTPYDVDGPLVIDVDGRVQSFDVQIENGTAYAPISITAPIFAHIASGTGFSVLDADGAPVARFSMEGAPVAIGQAEGRCRV
jgi:hypothetical protein